MPGLKIGTPAETAIPRASVDSVSCTAPGDCSAGGFYTYGDSQELAFVVDEKGGIWGKAHYLPGISATSHGAVNSVSCVSPGNCSAGGSYDGIGISHAFIVNETDGTWGKAAEVPGLAALNQGAAEVNAVSCTAPGDCSAGGLYGLDGDQARAFVVDERDGAWGTAHTVPAIAGLAGAGGYDAEVNSVSCASPGNCSAGGWAGNAVSGQAFVVDEADGTWGSPTEVPGSAALNIGGNAMVTSVSCAAPGDCAVGGFYAVSVEPTYSVNWQVFVADETGGTWGGAREIPGIAALNAGDNAQVTSVSCASPGNCAVGGDYSTTRGDIRGQAAFQRGFLVNETGGTWGKAHGVPGVAGQGSGVYSVSCTAPGDCVAGGEHGDLLAGNEKALVADEANGTWGTARNVPGMTAINTGGASYVTSVSCASVTDCAAVGSYSYGVNGENTDGFVVDKSVHQPTATVVKLSAPKVTYGHEQAEHVSVKVSAVSGGIPAGTVTVKSGSATVCTITLVSGKGSCAPTARRFPAGHVRVTASYGGNFTFGVSVSATAGFTVAKAATSTRLALSTAKVTYGHEQSAKLSVSVSSRYAGTVTGKVTVKAGKTTVCVVTLKSGKGACTIAARKLPAGTYTLTATYPGSPDYGRSASTRKTLVVVS